MMAVDDQAHRVLAAPISNVELTVVALIGYAAYEDGIVLSTQLVGEHLGERRGNSHTPTPVVKKAIRGLRPFQDDVRTLMGVKGDEALVEFETFRLQNAYSYFNACLANLADTAALNLGKGIYAAANASLYSFSYYQIGARRRLAVMRAGFETHIDGSLA